LVFEERGNRSARRKPLDAEWRTNKLSPHLTPDLGIEPIGGRRVLSPLRHPFTHNYIVSVLGCWKGCSKGKHYKHVSKTATKQNKNPLYYLLRGD